MKSKLKGQNEMYQNLKAEMARRNLNSKEFAEKIKMKHSTFLSRLRGNVDFTLPEALRIKEFFNGLAIEYLFEKS